MFKVTSEGHPMQVWPAIELTEDDLMELKENFDFFSLDCRIATKSHDGIWREAEEGGATYLL